jgi:mRNA-degrading endonuclease toxin of MazEF toxin-antitoxin module
MFDVGDVCLMELPLSDGHEQTGQRPCLIISDRSKYAFSYPLYH